jgi:hypothetical protein
MNDSTILDRKLDVDGTRGKMSWRETKTHIYGIGDYYGIERVFTFLLSEDGHWTIGTLPTMLSAQLLVGQMDTIDNVEDENLRSAGVHWTLQTSQPVVKSACSPEFYDTGNIFYIHVDGSTSILQNATELFDTMLKTNANSTSFMSWIRTPQDPTSLLALFMNTQQHASYIVCTVSSFWWDTSTSLSLTSTHNLLQTDWPGSTKDIVQDRFRPIVIDPEGITELSGFVDSLTFVAIFVAALSLVPSQVSNTDRHSIFEGKNSSSIKDSTSYTSFRIVRTVTGYGYGGTGTSIQLSLAVIVAYCFITISYVIYIIVTGHTSVAWNSATEIIMLALQSKEPNDLGHVSVGVDSMETLRKSVGIRVITMNIADTGEHIQKLELVFEHDVQDKKRMLKKVERNRAY